MTFPTWMRELGKVYKEQGEAIFIEIPLSKLEKTMVSLKKHGLTVVSCISSYDSGKEIEVLYHFIHTGLVLTLKVRTNRKKPSVPSVSGLFPSATLFELENREMMGIDFRGGPKPNPVLFARDTPRTPLRKKEAKDAKAK